MPRPGLRKLNRLSWAPSNLALSRIIPHEVSYAVLTACGELCFII
jgi:hypothetical protein